jgi:serine protease AprX
MTDHARKVIGIETLNQAGERWTGKDELIAVIDSGVDATHPDLASRLHVAETVPGATATDQFGHGTHVAGTIAGTGAASNGHIRGMAPDARLISLGIVDEAKNLLLPTDLGDLLRQVARHGAKIINLSWDTSVASVYEEASMAVDTFTRERPDVLVVIAAGNDGEAPVDYPPFYSIGAPATAKNALTVGACASDRGDFAGITWGKYAPRRFPRPPTSDQLIAGNPELPAALSSRGPTDTNSIKPDLLAPGTAILAPRAAGVPDREFWRSYASFEGRYAFMNGTSMATPIVSGAAAVVRQYLREEHKLANPSSALMRAVLIAAAGRVPWAREKADEKHCGYPDFDQGFGRLDLSKLLPHSTCPQRRAIALLDVANEDDDALESRAPEGVGHKAVHKYAVTVAEGASDPLRIVLAWTDHSVRSVQNALGLDLEVKGQRKRGNEGHTWLLPPARFTNPRLAGIRYDDRNTVQQIEIEDPLPGSYKIRVLGRNTLFPPQGFALCVCGELEGELVRES